MERLDILALEPWNAGSHRAVVDSISRHSAHRWHWCTGEGGGVRWCLRHSGLAFAERIRREAGESGPWDLVLVSSLCSLSDFRAAAPAAVRSLPHVLCMHENQAAYPVSDRVRPRDRERDAHLSFTNLASIVAADHVIWNSRYNLESFLEAMDPLLRRSTIPVEPGWEERIREKSSVSWPPVDVPDVPGSTTRALHNPGLDGYGDRPQGGRPVVRVAWPHRWEHDKGCEELEALIGRCRDDDRFEFRWSILGHRFDEVPPAMQRIERNHGAVLDRFGGPANRGDYLEALGGCDWVCSTARHEFFGIAVVEGLLMGCLPWLPDRLSYPELLPECWRGLDPWTPGVDPIRVRQSIRSHLEPARAPAAVAHLDSLLAKSGNPEPAPAPRAPDSTP
ncbi:MAG: DUF3524 domain-containing protein [Planctomycetota bacterium]|nr:DUF3524 domain-containing protein [Planctomycetota bacterium]MED5507162.1 DUF3524 domain-containing protein [Planctomycetota bacterium]